MTTTPPADPDALLIEGVRAHQAGRLDAATEHYRAVLRQRPGDAHATHYLGLIAFQRGDHRLAARLIGDAIAAAGAAAPAEFHVNAGNALKRAGRPADAEAAYRAALRRRPDFTPALYNLALLRRSLGDAAEAAALLRHALHAEPGQAAIRVELAECLAAQGLDRAALEQLDAAAGDDSPALRARAGRLLVELGRPARAAELLEAVLAADDGADYESLNALGCAYASLGRLADAAGVLGRALALAPGDERAVDNLAATLKDGGRSAEALALYRRHLDPQRSSAVFRSNYLMTLLYADDADPAATLAEHRRWAAPAPPPQRPPRKPGAAGPLRLGYLSGDLRDHPVAHFLRGILGAHDRRRVEVVVYDNTPVRDRWSEALRATPTRWVPVRALDDRALAEAIRGDAIDVLIDLSGHTAENRLAALAGHPARVQASYLGYPHSTGLPWIDYRLVDAVTDPEGSDAHSSERLLRLPRSYYAYTPPDDAPAVAPSPLAATGRLRFGVCSNLAKVGRRTLDLWALVLRRYPEATLRWRARAFADASVRAAMQAALVDRDVAASRLRFDAWAPAAERWNAYHEIDVALDTLPYNQATNTCEALWMGVPTLSFAGNAHRARMGASILCDAGLAEWIVWNADAGSPNELERRLASQLDGLLDPRRLAALRSGMRDRLRVSRLFDVADAARAIEDACAVMSSAADGPGARR